MEDSSEITFNIYNGGSTPCRKYMQNIAMLIKEQMFCSERAGNSFPLLSRSLAHTHSGAPRFMLPVASAGLGGMQSYLLYYIIYIFRLFLGLIAVEAHI